MTYRRIDTQTWQDPWFESLSLQAKLLFIYLYTNDACNQAGMYKISKKRIQFDTGVDIDKYMPELEKKVFWDPERSLVWVKNFLKYQSQNQSFLDSAIKVIEGMPEDMQSMFVDHYQNTFDKHGVAYSNLCHDTYTPPREHSPPTEGPRSHSGTEADTGTGTEAEAEAGGSCSHTHPPSAAAARASPSDNEIPYKEITDAWNEHLEKNKAPFPRATHNSNNKTRLRNLKARWKEYPDLEKWLDLFDRVTRSNFLRDKQWFDFTWLIKSPNNFQKAMEGKYDDREEATYADSKSAPF